jgi:hypothetical protein
MNACDIKSVKSRLSFFKFKKDLKKDEYKINPNVKLYREILELISIVKYLESKLI